jgi:cephalosporin hydroxylase
MQAKPIVDKIKEQIYKDFVLAFKRKRQYTNPNSRREIANQFLKLYFDALEFDETYCHPHFLGTPVIQCVSDLWVYQEILYERRPDVIIECGTRFGGSALYLASICDLISNGEIISIDVVEKQDRPQHKRITYLTGSSTSDRTLKRVKEYIAPKDRVMVFLDSDHSKDHVVEELRAYGPLVTVGDYLIVEDTSINGHPILPKFGPGPMEAVQEFLGETDSFVVDVTKEKFFVTFHPRGYLRKIG